ncbi:MAG: phosphate signaling complex protein PhoU [Candidatus Krumholzibacteriota bacterium]|nr:phosphate signaling complex protein PhoU [Candidatus Krumholzibacteriota bacterium]
MSRHIGKEIENLKKSILIIGTTVEESLSKAVKSLEKRDADLAKAVIDGDIDIDRMEVELEEDCLKVLALYQPVAIDLRLIISVLKINNDLERVGDLSVNIAERALYLAMSGREKSLYDFSDMTTKVREMLKKSLDALVQESSQLAHEVCRMDEIVDTFNRDFFLRIHQDIKDRPEDVEYLIHQLSISRHLERIADQATNIAEDVIYMIEGEIIRHKAEDYFTGTE